MADKHKRTAACMCGAISFEVTLPEQGSVVSCHCKMCRNWTGGSSFMGVSAPSDAIAYTQGQSKVSWYDSSEQGRRGFCSECGSKLFWDLKEANITNIAAGLFHDSSWLEHKLQIFVDHRAPWLPLSTHCKAMTTEELFASMGWTTAS